MPWGRRIPLADYAARRIALIKPSSLGDIVHSLPVLTALRRRFPTAHIAWVVNRTYEPLLRGHPDLDATFPFDRGASKAGWPRALTAYGRWAAALLRQRFDLVIDLQGLLRSALMAAASGATRRVGLSTAREGAAFAYTDVVRVADPGTVHAVDRWGPAAGRRSSAPRWPRPSAPGPGRCCGRSRGRGWCWASGRAG